MKQRRLVSRPVAPNRTCAGAHTRFAAATGAIGAMALILALLPVSSIAARDGFSPVDAATVPLEELMKIQVTTVGGAEEDWFRTPAAVHVVTGEDLRRTGHRTLAEALRIVPGVFVGQSSSHDWNVGMRGFNGGLDNKTLVLIDGRSVYDPLFGGTFWDVQDILLSDLDRIEVIRGPGATLWGANAVNGVINVITKNTADTQGIALKAGGGTEYKGFGSARYGGRFSEGGTYKIWGKYFNNDHYSTNSGSAHDAWDMGHGGFRIDYEDGAATRYMFEADIYNLGQRGEAVAVPVPNQHFMFTEKISTGWANGGHALFRATHDYAPDAGWSVQAYYDRTNRTQEAGLHIERDTGDIDFRHHFQFGSRHAIRWGVGDRYSADRTKSSPDTAYTFNPRSRSFNTVNGFVQDTITLLPDRVFAMLGTKLEYNSFTGFEIQPGARLWWTDERNMVWASISRPVRVPSRIEQDAFASFAVIDTGQFAGGGPSGVFETLGVQGNPDAKAEKLIAYELGYRRRVTDDLTIDLTPFYNDYTRLLYIPRTIFGTWTNAGSGESYGIEITSMWRAMENWELEGSYSYLEVQIHGDLFPHDELTSPRHQVKLRSHLDLTDWIECNTALYYVDQYRMQEVPDYVRLDQGFTWHVTDDVDLTIWGQNLLDQRHRETSRTIQVERGVYAEVTWEFE